MQINVHVGQNGIQGSYNNKSSDIRDGRWETSFINMWLQEINYSESEQAKIKKFLKK